MNIIKKRVVTDIFDVVIIEHRLQTHRVRRRGML